MLGRLPCVAAAAGSLTGRLTNPICSLPCPARVSLTSSGKLKASLCGTAVRELVIDVGGIQGFALVLAEQHTLPPSPGLLRSLAAALNPTVLSGSACI